VDYRSLKFPEPEELNRRRRPDVLREPVRALVFVAAIATAIGALLPWLHAEQPGYAPYDISGFEQAGDGGLILELVVLAAYVAWSERAWRSRYALIVGAPFVLGLLNLAILRLALTNFDTLMRFLERAGGHAQYLPGFFLTVAGIVALVIGGALAIWQARRRLSFAVGVDRSAVAGISGGVVGAVGGFIGGSRVAEMLTSGAIAGVSTTIIVLMAFTLAFVGAWLGAIVGAGLARSSRRTTE
jgi:hypothetical protein